MEPLKPSEYLQEIVLHTVKEFEDEDSSIRRAYLACVTVYHFVNAVSLTTSQSVSGVMADIESRTPHFQCVRDVATLAKHAYLRPDAPGNKGRHLMSQADIGVSKAAPFTDGAYFSDGSSWADSPQVVTVKGDDGLPVDILFCVLDFCPSNSGLSRSQSKPLRVAGYFDD